MTGRVLVPIADGTEELEAVTLIDVLRRAGAEVTVASVEPSLTITASRGVRLVADCSIRGCVDQDYDLIALPGGMPGAERLRDSAELRVLLQDQHRRGACYAAICAAPAVVLQPQGLLAGMRATAHPDFIDRLPAAVVDQRRVVVDGNCITSRGAGTALEFALALVTRLYGQPRAEQVATAMVADGG